MKRTWPIDPNRIHVSLAAWGMMELKYGQVYSYIHGWRSCQVNGYVMWEPETITDKEGRWEITIRVDESCYLDEGTVDLTPRRCQEFTAAGGRTFTWTNAVLPADPERADEDREDDQPEKKPPRKPRVIQDGVAVADEHGLVTIERLTVTKARHRITLRAK